MANVSNDGEIYLALGKESTEVRIKQNKGKERENSYQKFRRSP